MLSNKEKIRLFLGFLVVAGIFAFLFASSCAQKNAEVASILDINKKYDYSLPKNFKSEIFDIDDLGYTDLLVSDTGKIIGFTLSKNPVDAYGLVKSKLIANNWKFVESGSNTAGSFSKQGSEINWLFLNCIDVGDGTSVVITCN